MASLGEELRKQREMRQIPLREISDATKISIRFLEALERNDFTHLPGGQFNKGFIRAYSRHIGVDPEKMIDAYDEELRRQEDESRTGIAEQNRARREGLGPAVVMAAVLILVVAVLAAGGLGIAWFMRSPARATQSASPAAPGGEAPGAAPASLATSAPAAGGSPEGLDMEMSCLQPAYARVVCDGEISYEGELHPGDMRSARCVGEVRIIMGDPAALTVRIGPSDPSAGAGSGKEPAPAHPTPP